MARSPLPLLLLLVVTLSLWAVAAGWTVRPMNVNCPVPSCVSRQDLNTLWASPDATQFVRCRPAPTGYWMVEQKTCAPGTLFQFSRQACVTATDWSSC
ncbi:uncharacterized protein LOC118460695 [Anopheles albimanus]|nr:uncharacterized protein LOC118460695 [Anopheles albimanus]